MKATSHITVYKHSYPTRCRIQVESLRRDRTTYYRVCLFMPTGIICEDTNTTIYNALVNIRRQIEPDGWRLGINASRYDAISGTEFNDVFVYVPNHAGVWQKALALDDVPLADIATVEQQLDYAEWIKRSNRGPIPEVSQQSWWRYIRDREKRTP
jgi:hypothetical protein